MTTDRDDLDDGRDGRDGRGGYDGGDRGETHDQDRRLEERLQSALVLIADDVPAPRPPDLTRLAAVRRRRRSTAAAVLAAAIAIPVGWTALRPTGPQVAGRVEVAGVLTVTCTPGRTEVDAGRVEVSADGVHLRVLNRTGGPTVVSFGPADPADGFVVQVSTGGVSVTGSQADLVAPVPPPRLRVSCDGPDGGQPTAAAIVRLDDPHELYRRVDVEGVLGCTFSGSPLGPGSTGTTLREAAERAAGGVTGGVRLLPGPGYSAAPDLAAYLGKGDRNRVLILVAKDADGRFVAYVEYVCAPGSWRR